MNATPSETANFAIEAAAEAEVAEERRSKAEGEAQASHEDAQAASAAAKLLDDEVGWGEALDRHSFGA